MKFRRLFIAITLILAGLNAGCRSFPYLVGLRKVSPAQAAPPVNLLTTADPESKETLETGRKIYTTQCARCHSCMPIQDFTSEEWMNSIIPRMALKAKLTPEETDSLKQYVELAHRHLPSILLSSGPSEYR